MAFKTRAQKYLACDFRKNGNHRAVPPRQEGRFAIVTKVRRDAVDADALTDEQRRRGRPKSCGPDAPLQASNWRQCWRIAPVMVANAGSPRRARSKP
jgi:hypothetical protein